MLSKQIRPHSASKPPPAEVTKYVQPFLFSLGMEGAGKSRTNPRQMLCALWQRLQTSDRKICLVLLKERLNQTSRLFILKHICLLHQRCTKLRQGELPWLPLSGQLIPNLCRSRACAAHSWRSQVFFETSTSGFICFGCCPRAGPGFQRACTSQTPPSFPHLRFWATTLPQEKLYHVSTSPRKKLVFRAQASPPLCIWCKGGGKLSCPQVQPSSLAIAGPLEEKWEHQQR